MIDNFKGFSLFNDIEETDLRNRNRAVVLANIAEDQTKRQLLTPKGVSLILGYFDVIPQEDREDVKTRFTHQLIARGYSVV